MPRKSTIDRSSQIPTEDTMSPFRHAKSSNTSNGGSSTSASANVPLYLDQLSNIQEVEVKTKHKSQSAAKAARRCRFRELNAEISALENEELVKGGPSVSKVNKGDAKLPSDHARINLPLLPTRTPSSAATLYPTVDVWSGDDDWVISNAAQPLRANNAEDNLDDWDKVGSEDATYARAAEKKTMEKAKAKHKAEERREKDRPALKLKAELYVQRNVGYYDDEVEAGIPERWDEWQM